VLQYPHKQIVNLGEVSNIKDINHN